jgi:hypothetical protein
MAGSARVRAPAKEAGGLRCNVEVMAKGAEPLFAVVRLDRPYDGDPDRLFDNPSSYVVVKEVLPTSDEAEREAERLNALNADKGAVYFATPTRFFPNGRTAS